MPQKFKFPDGTILSTPDGTSKEDAITFFNSMQQETAPEPRITLGEAFSAATIEAALPDQTLFKEALGGPVRTFGRTLEGLSAVADLFRRNQINEDTRSTLLITSFFPGGLTQERANAIRETGRKRLHESLGAEVNNFLQLEGSVINQLPFGQLPEEIERASILEIFEEEGLVAAVELAARKFPGFAGEQAGVLLVALAAGGPFSSTPLITKLAPNLLGKGIVGKVAGVITPQTLAAGIVAGPGFEAPQTVLQVFEKGGTDEQATKAFVEMAAGTAFLDAIGIGQFFRKIPKGVLPKLGRILLTAGVDAFTEAMEEFVEADALARVGIEPFVFKEVLKQAVEVGIMTLLFAGTASAIQQGSTTFSPETELENRAKRLDKITKTIKTPSGEIVITADTESVKQLEAAFGEEEAVKIKEQLDVSKQFSSIEVIRELKKQADIAKEKQEVPPRLVDKEGNIVYKMSEETFAELTEAVRQPGQSTARPAAEAMRVIFENFIAVTALSKGISPEEQASRTLAFMGIQTVDSKPILGDTEIGLAASEVKSASDVLGEFFSGRLDKRELSDVLDTIVRKPRLSRAAEFLQDVAGFELSKLINEEGFITNEAVQAKLASINEQFRIKETEEQIALQEGPEVVEEEGLEQTAPQPTPGEEEIAPVVEAIVELAAAVKPPSINAQAVADAGISSSNTLRIQDDLGLLSDEDFAKELGFTENKQVADYKRQVRVQKKRIKFAKAADIKTALLNALDEAAVSAALIPNNELINEEGGTPGSWILLMEDISKRDNTAIGTIAASLRREFGEVVRENKTKTRITLEQAKGMMAEAVTRVFPKKASLRKRVLTPDGKNISLLTADLAARTRTKAFKDWFGDSKVIDANGEPLVVFHGTRIVRFAPENQFRPLSHFGTARAATDRINRPSESIDQLRVDFPGENEDTKVIQSFLKIENPIEMEDVSPFDNLKHTRLELDRLLPDRSVDINAIDGISDKRDNLDLANIAAQEGFDGATYTNSQEDPGSTSWVIFDSAQAKSPMNKGTYEVSNGNVLFSKEENLIRGQIIGVDESGSAISVREATKYLIRAFQASNISTGIHEMWHYGALVAGGQLKLDIEAAMSTPAERTRKKITKIEDWSDNRHERWAKSGERYMVQGVAPKKEWVGLFSIIREQLALAYQTMRGYILPLMNPELNAVFDHFFLHYGPGKALADINGRLNQVDKLMNTRDSFGALNQADGKSIRKYYNSINITHFDNDPEMKEVVLNILDELGSLPKKSDAEVTAKALKLFEMKGADTLREEFLTKVLDSGHMDDVEIVAAVMLFDRIKATAFNLIIKGKKNTPEYEKAVSDFRDIIQIRQIAGNAASSNLFVFRKFDQSEKEATQFLQQMEKMDPALLKQLANLDITRPEEIEEVYRNLDKIGKKMLVSIYINNVFDFDTLGRNFLFTMMHMFTMVPTRAIAGLIERVNANATGEPQKLYMGEAMFLFNSLWRVPLGIDGKAWKAAWEAFNKQIGPGSTQKELAQVQSRIDEQSGIPLVGIWDYFIDVYDTSNELGVKATIAWITKQARAHKVFRKVLTYSPSFFTRSMVATDIWMKVITEIGEAKAIRYRLEKNFNARIDENTTEEDILDAHIEHEKSMLGNTYEDVFKIESKKLKLAGADLSVAERKRFALIESQMKRRAEESTFQTEPEKHGLTQWTISLKQRFPLLGNALVLFVRTLANLTHTTTQFTPVLGPAAELGYDAITKDKRQGLYARVMPSELVAKQMMGLAFTLLFLYLWHKGILTGPPPEDKNERLLKEGTGWKPFSFNPPGTNHFFEFRYIDIFGTMATMVTSIAGDLEQLANDKQDPEASQRRFFEKLWFVTGDVAAVASDSFFASGALETVQFVSGRVSAQQAEREIARKLSGVLPNSSFMRSMSDMANQENYGGQPVMDDESILQYLAEAAPYIDMFVSDAEPKIDAFGEKVIRQTRGDVSGVGRFLTMWSPINYSILKPDQVEKQFMDAGFYPGPPSRFLDFPELFQRRPLDEDIYIKYATESGHLVKELVQDSIKTIEDEEDINIKRIILQRMVDKARIGPRANAMEEQRKRIESEL